jgi:N-acetylglucosamine-6-phosphate deacetylase
VNHQPYALIGAQVLLPHGHLGPAAVEVVDGRISEVIEGRYRPPAGMAVRELPGKVLAPGLIDTHVHGRAGRNVMEATRGGIDAIATGLLAHGVTAFVATTASTNWGCLLSSVAGLAQLVGPVEDGAELLGIHLEGPFLNPARRGVHPAENLCAPTAERVDELLQAARGSIRICTLAPELPGAREAIARLVAVGVRTSLGHTDASFDQTVEALEGGARRATHLFNAMPPVHHRQPGPVPALLADPRVYLELIADGLHVDANLVQVLMCASDLAGRIVLISDGTDVAGRPDGQYRRWEGTEVVVREGRSYTTEGSVAGSTSTLMDGVRVAASAGVPIAIALAAASHTPARSIGLSDRGHIRAGYWADLLVLDDQLNIDTTILHGRDHK